MADLQGAALGHTGRGYDPSLPWAAKESRRRKPTRDDGEEAGTRERMDAFAHELQAMAPARTELQLPCYYDAWKMGLWDPAHPNTLRERIDCHAGSTRGVIAPRWLVEKEIRLLVDAAGRQIDGLAGKADFLLWGPAQEPYASYDAELRKKFDLREGSPKDWQGVVGQKIPRFDNRIIEKCALIPRLNVCKIKSDGGEPLPESRVIFDATFLMKLKNMRVQRGAEQSGLTAAEIGEIFSDPKRKTFKVTETQWRKFCEKHGLLPLPGYPEVEPPRAGGRSRFCRPALTILKRLILSGQTPSDFYRAELERLNGNLDPNRGFVPDDLMFLQRMGTTWEGIHVPDQKLDALLESAKSPEEAIRSIIGSQNDPIVRHRLGVFHERIKTLRATYGVPETVVLEFVREDFMGAKAVIEYRAFLKKRATERKRAREDATQSGATERSAGLKLELLREQGGICLYTGKGLRETQLDQYEIEHIVPRSQGGADAVINYVLTTHATNKTKGEQTPFQWLGTSDGWDAYTQRVRARARSLRNKKVKLLLSADAAELAERYTALAETAWITKLARAILDAFFGWRNGVDKEGRKRVVAVNGGLTARIRRNYKLNRLLNPEATDEEEAEKKNRSDDRHHALDAMVISFIPGWMCDASKEHFFRFPGGVHRESFGQYLAAVRPRPLALPQPALEETFYGLRQIHGDAFIVKRRALFDLAVKEVVGRQELKPRRDIRTRKIVDGAIRELVENFLANHPLLTLGEWRAWCETAQLGAHGPRIKQALMTETEPNATEEYGRLGKSGDKGREQYRRGKSHTGYFVTTRAAPTKKEPARRRIEVRPVYAFQRREELEKQLRAQAGIEIIDYFQAGCQVTIAKPWEFKGQIFPADEYTLKNMWTDRRAVLKHGSLGFVGALRGGAPVAVPLRLLVEAQMRRKE